jgi:hypothetical protein
MLMPFSAKLYYVTLLKYVSAKGPEGVLPVQKSKKRKGGGELSHSRVARPFALKQRAVKLVSVR